MPPARPGDKTVRFQAVGEMTGTPHPKAGRGEAGAGREPISSKEQDATSRSVLAVFWVWGHGGEQGNAVLEIGSAAPAPVAASRTRRVAGCLLPRTSRVPGQ